MNYGKFQLFSDFYVTFWTRTKHTILWVYVCNIGKNICFYGQSCLSVQRSVRRLQFLIPSTHQNQPPETKLKFKVIFHTSFLNPTPNLCSPFLSSWSHHKGKGTHQKLEVMTSCVNVLQRPFLLSNISSIHSKIHTIIINFELLDLAFTYTSTRNPKSKSSTSINRIY